MGKMGLAGVSLVAAVPGGLLFALLLMGAISNLGTMPTIMKAVAILVMVIGLAMALFPLYLLVWYRGSRVVLANDKKPALAAAAIGAAGGGALGEDFLEDLNPSSDEILADQREDDVYGETGSFDSTADLGALDEFDENASHEFEAVGEMDSTTDLSSLDIETGDPLETTEFTGDDLLEFAEAEESGSEHDLLASDGLQDEFDFEFFDDDEEKKS